MNKLMQMIGLHLAAYGDRPAAIVLTEETFAAVYMEIKVRSNFIHRAKDEPEIPSLDDAMREGGVTVQGVRIYCAKYTPVEVKES